MTAWKVEFNLWRHEGDRLKIVDVTCRNARPTAQFSKNLYIYIYIYRKHCFFSYHRACHSFLSLSLSLFPLPIFFLSFFLCLVLRSVISLFDDELKKWAILLKYDLDLWPWHMKFGLLHSYIDCSRVILIYGVVFEL